MGNHTDGMATKKPVRFGQGVFLTLSPADAKLIRERAKQRANTVSGYVSSLLSDRRQPNGRPAHDWRVPARIGNCIVDALALAQAAEQPAIVALLQEARQILMDDMLSHVASYDAAVIEQTDEDTWGSV